jgi:hypothetical protein
MGEQSRRKRCVFIAYADHAHTNDSTGERSRADHEFFQSVVAEVRDAGIVVYHRENYQWQPTPGDVPPRPRDPDSRIISNVKDHLTACSHLAAVVERHSSSVGWEIGWSQGKDLDMRYLCLAPQGSYITRTYSGMAELGEVELKRYRNKNEIARLIIEFVNEIE